MSNKEIIQPEKLMTEIAAALKTSLVNQQFRNSITPMTRPATAYKETDVEVPRHTVESDEEAQKMNDYCVIVAGFNPGFKAGHRFVLMPMHARGGPDAQKDEVNPDRRSVSLTFTHETIGDDLFAPMVKAASEEYFSKPMTAEDFTASNGVRIQLAIHE